MKWTKFFKYLFKYGGMPSFEQWQMEKYGKVQKRPELPTKSEFVKDMYEEMDRKRKKNKEVWHYICENGHKWESYSSPTGTFCEGEYGIQRTRCPTCGSDICMGTVYINGKYAKMGAMHMDFGKNRK